MNVVRSPRWLNRCRAGKKFYNDGHNEQTKKKLSDIHKKKKTNFGKIWVTDGLIEKMIFECEIENGFYPGRITNPTLSWGEGVRDNISQRMKNNQLSKGIVRTKEQCEAISKRKKGSKWSEESKAKLKLIPKEKRSMYGRTHSEETIEKMRIAALAREAKKRAKNEQLSNSNS